jgi:Helix-turn-helix domain
MYNVDEVFELLKTYKITTHKESVRRWLRQGDLKGIAPSSRKEGWQIPKESLDNFLQQRLPEGYTIGVAKEPNTTIVEKEVKERIRADMWIQIANKNLWEGHVELKKTRIHECIQHRRYSKELESEVWKRCVANSRAYKKPRIFYLLEAFGFEGKRLLLDKDFEDLEEQVIFAIIEHIRTHSQEVKVEEKPKGPEGTEDFVSLENIIVPEVFLNSTPNPEKTQKVVNYVKRTGCLDEPIMINRDTMILSDGYRRYIVAKKMKMDIVPVVYEKVEVKNL